MSKTNYDYIQFANYKGIPNWSVQYVVEEQLGFTKKYPMAKIGSFLKRSKNLVEIQDNVEYKRVSISTIGKGVTVRDTKRGINIGTKKQYIIRKGQFLVSKIDARNGAFGVVPEEADGAIITGNFWAFDVDFNKIAPQYLVLVTQTNQFVSFVEKCSNGTTNRHYLQEDAFLQQAIPLPSLEEQKAIISVYDNSMRKIAENEREINSNAVSMDAFFLSTLGVKRLEKVNKDTSRKMLFFSSLAKLSRWDCYNDRKPKYMGTDAIPLGKLIKAKPMYGAPYSAVAFNGKMRYIRITDINEDGSLNELKVSANSYNSTYLLEENDLLIARSGNTVGKTFLYNKNDGPAIFAGYLIKFVVDENKVKPQYLLTYTKSSLFKDWVRTNLRISAQPNINSQQYLQAPIIVPAKSVQDDIIRMAADIYKINTNLKKQVVYLKEKALKEFEQTIFE